MRGFTLIEVLLALGLAAVILGAIYSLLYTGAKGWKRMRARQEMLQMGRAILERMTTDLQSALPLAQGGWKDTGAFTGTENSVTFPALLSLADPNAAQAPFEIPSVGVLAYRFTPSSGGASASSLERDWTLMTPDPDNFSATSGKDAYSDFVTSVTFSYAYQNDPGGYPQVIWNGHWHQTSRIPGGVRVDLLLTRGDTGEQLALSKTISIPQGRLGDANWVSHAKN